MRRKVKITLSILAVATMGIGLSAWAISVRAPKPIRVGFDFVSRSLGIGDPRTRCKYIEHGSGFGKIIASIESRQCEFFAEPRRFKGIYIDEFEGQRFIEGAFAATQYRPVDDVWMTFDDTSDLSRAPLLRDRDGRSSIWSVDFIGRKTIKKGRYGHFGMSTEEVLVDRVLAAKLLDTYEGYLPAEKLIR